MEFFKNAVKKYTDTSLILRIVIGLVIGAILGMTLKSWTWVGLLGTLFVGALRAIAPILVFVLIISALSVRSARDRANWTANSDSYCSFICSVHFSLQRQV